MPPKKTTPVASQKCGRCFKIHAPPFGEQCIALLLADEDKLQNSDETSEDSTHVDGQEVEQQLLGAVGGVPAGKGDSAVAAQLANLTSVVSHLASMFETTRQEVGALRSEVSSMKQSRPGVVSGSAVAASAPVAARLWQYLRQQL
jgi:hypothetical protein